jgi:hypothetical protein
LVCVSQSATSAKKSAFVDQTAASEASKSLSEIHLDASERKCTKV